jgi:D-3-phosphoglycerate dehydrogenase
MSVYLNEYVDPTCLARLEGHFEVVDTLDRPDEVEAIITHLPPVDDALMARLPNLRAISVHGVGTNAVDLDAARRRSIIVTNTPGANARATAELVVGLILDVCRNITCAAARCRSGGVEAPSPEGLGGVEVLGRTLGLVGAGHIARIVAKILVGGFDCDVVAYDPYMPAETMRDLGFARAETVDELIGRSDIVNVSVPLTPATENLISGATFDRFRPDAVLVNAARGGIVNEDDLYDALVAGKLRAAACDAFVVEPPTSATTRLLGLDNFVGTPHIGALTHEALVRMGNDAVDHVISVLEGGAPACRVV